MQRKSRRRTRRLKNRVTKAPEAVKGFICIHCAAYGKQERCPDCARLQPEPMHETARKARESYAAYYDEFTETAFRRHMAGLRVVQRETRDRN